VDGLQKWLLLNCMSLTKLSGMEHLCFDEIVKCICGSDVRTADASACGRRSADFSESAD
jgi:hypothetical protein